MRVVSGIEVTLVRTAAEGPSFPVGGIFSVAQPATDEPDQTWIYVKAGAATLAPGTVAMKASGSATCSGVILATDASAALAVVPVGRIVGVAQHEIAATSYGFVLARGKGNVLAFDSGNNQLDEPLVVNGTTGRAMIATEAESTGVLGVGLANAGGTPGVVFAAFIDCL
jgi:hypothetical protein